MLQAQLKGKLSIEEERMEDLLVSNVFGSMKYLKPEDGLLPILHSAEDINGKKLFSNILTVNNIHYEFWPWLHEKDCNRCQPDVLISFTLPDGRKVILLVEAKYLSGKSSEADDKIAPKDQLAMEFDNLQKKAGATATPILLFITPDFGYPKEDVEKSIEEYKEKREEKENPIDVYWVSWRRLVSLYPRVEENSILFDLLAVLRRIRLTFYEGITVPKLPSFMWTFNASVGWTWAHYELYSFSWKYKAIKNFNWHHDLERSNWRFNK